MPAVEAKLKMLLQSYVPMIRLKGTGNYAEIPAKDEFERAMYDTFSLASGSSHPDLEVNFIYLNWPIYFDITPKEGALLMPSSYRRDFPFDAAPPTQTNHYEFFYDVSYPVLIEIRDDDALKGEGYSFIFAMEGTVFDNKNLALWHMGEGTIGPTDHTDVSAEVSLDSWTEPKKKLFCDEEQRVSGPVEIMVVDSSGNPLDDAQVSYGCADYARCSAGVTEEGSLKTRLSTCKGGGFVTVRKEGFMPASAGTFDILPDKELNVAFRLERLKGFKIDVQVLGAGAKKLAEDEKLVLSIRRENEKPFEELFSRTVIYDGKDLELELCPGLYEVQAQLISDSGYIIPSTEEMGQKIPETEIAPAVVGGAVLDSETGYWRVNKGGHMEEKSITFYVFRSAPPTSHTEIGKMQEYEDLSKSMRSDIEPKFQ